ncbi:MAG: VTT domain-containing protein [Pirellulales bacterium]|nr:VTT domain-containing protein [Pirellulales bacterium]
MSSLLIVVAGGIAVVRLLPVGRLTDMLTGAIQDMGVWGPVLFAGVYVLATVLMLPGSALTLVGSGIFGLWWGLASVSVGSTVGAACAFLIARYVARPAVERKLAGSKTFKAVDRAVEQGGWKIVALLRLSPAIPFNIQNYLYGLTAIRFWPCVLASWVAMLPGTFMYVYLGYAGGEGVAAATGEQSKSMAEWVLLGIGLLATIVVTVYVTRLARRAMQRAADFKSTETALIDDSPTEPIKVKPAKPVVTAAYVVVATVVAVGAVFANIYSTKFQSLFGPPPVVSQETYTDILDGPNFDHSQLDALLTRYVNERGGVDYAGLMSERKVLQAYIASLGKAPFAELDRNEKLALLINAYNAFTLELVLEHWNNGRMTSIKDDIPAEDRWDVERWKVGGSTWSLNQIEHDQIRPHFKEPRIHFALVCAAVGCPPLRSEAYTAERLEEQLADQTEYVHTHDRWFQLDADRNQVRLTQLYTWYRDDFEQSAGSVLQYAAQHSAELKRLLEAGKAPRKVWLNYEWALNSQQNLR